MKKLLITLSVAVIFLSSCKKEEEGMDGHLKVTGDVEYNITSDSSLIIFNINNVQVIPKQRYKIAVIKPSETMLLYDEHAFDAGEIASVKMYLYKDGHYEVGHYKVIVMLSCYSYRPPYSVLREMNIE
jgi:hypothetical protein